MKGIFPIDDAPDATVRRGELCVIFQGLPASKILEKRTIVPT
jgi:hypothetical protein